jgi:hypothetical protein
MLIRNRIKTGIAPDTRKLHELLSLIFLR